MITGKLKESHYRKLDVDSSSSLKLFSENKRKYHKKYILKKEVEEEKSKALLIGSLVDLLLLEPELFDEKFYLSTCAKAPTGIMLDFVEALYKYTELATDGEGNITRDFKDIVADAFVESGFKISLEAVLKKFTGSDSELYYKEIRSVRNSGLTVVTTEDVTNAERIVNELKNNFVTRDIVNLVSDSCYSVYNHFPRERYDVNGMTFKSLIDKIVVDHIEHTIQIYDLKTSWSVEGFYDEYYLYRRAYIQAFLYWKSIINSENGLFDFEHEEYKVLCPAFIVCDSINYNNPLIYKLSPENLDEAEFGFEHKGKVYPGVNYLIEELMWCKENNIWNISRENYLNRGIVKLK
jgi:hypothetical protein